MALRNRSPVCCADLAVLVFLLVFAAGMISIAIVGCLEGDIGRLFLLVDSFGNVCGRGVTAVIGDNDTGFELSPTRYLFPMDATRPSETVWLCVAECPSESSFSDDQLYQYMNSRDRSLCFYDVPLGEFLTNRSFYPSSVRGPCPSIPVWQSKPVLSHCIPDLNNSGSKYFNGEMLVRINEEMFGYLNAIATTDLLFHDVILARWHIFASILLSFVLAILFLLYLLWRHYLSTCVLIVCTSFLSAAFLSIVVWVSYWKGSTQIDAIYDEHKLLRIDALNEHTMLILAILSSILLVFVFCLAVWTLVKQKVGMQRFAKFLECTFASRLPFLVLLQPLMTVVSLILFYAYWCVVLLLLISIAFADQVRFERLNENYVAIKNEPSIEMMSVQYLPVNSYRILSFLHTIGLIWGTSLILCCQHTIIAKILVQWYFKDKKVDFQKRSQFCLYWLAAFRDTITCHLGTIAFCALVRPLLYLPNLLLLLAIYVLPTEKYSSKCGRRLHHCIIFLKSFGQPALTIMALENKTYCDSATHARVILSWIAPELFNLQMLCRKFILYVKLTVTCFVCAFALILLQFASEVHFFALPLLLICVPCILIVTSFYSCLETITLTLTMCIREHSRLEQQRSSPSAINGDFVTLNPEPTGPTTSTPIDFNDGPRQLCFSDASIAKEEPELEVSRESNENQSLMVKAHPDFGSYVSTQLKWQLLLSP